MIEAIDWAVQIARRSTSASSTCRSARRRTQSYKDDPLCLAVERALRAGIVVVASAGNYGQTAGRPAGLRQHHVTGHFAVCDHGRRAEHAGHADPATTKLRPGARRARRCSITWSSRTWWRRATRFSASARRDPRWCASTPSWSSRWEREAAATVRHQHGGCGRVRRCEPVTRWSERSLARCRSAWCCSTRPRFQGRELLAGGTGNLTSWRRCRCPTQPALLPSLARRKCHRQLVFRHEIKPASAAIVHTAEAILWGNAETNAILWGNAESNAIFWGNADTILWGNADNILWGTRKHPLG